MADGLNAAQLNLGTGGINLGLDQVTITGTATDFQVVILEAQARRALAAVQAQEGHLSRQLARKPIRAPEDWRMTPKQEEQVRSALERLGVERKQKQTELDEVLQRILELDRELAKQGAAQTLRQLEAANVAAAREYKARKTAEIERRVAREARAEAAKLAAARVEAARVEALRVEAARVAAVAAALEARKREEEAVAVALWLAMFDGRS